jgi:hypothetical protein
LTEASDGSLFGTTSAGGCLGGGDIFQIFRAVAPISVSASEKGTGLMLNWNAVSGRYYQVQYCDDLSQGVWNSLGGQIQATNKIMAANDVSPEAQRFYRVQMQ